MPKACCWWAPPGHGPKRCCKRSPVKKGCAGFLIRSRAGIRRNVCRRRCCARARPVQQAHRNGAGHPLYQTNFDGSAGARQRSLMPGTRRKGSKRALSSGGARRLRLTFGGSSLWQPENRPAILDPALRGPAGSTARYWWTGPIRRAESDPAGLNEEGETCGRRRRRDK